MPYDPPDLNAYAADNPATNSDPTGQDYLTRPDDTGYVAPDAYTRSFMQQPATASFGSITDLIGGGLSVAYTIFKSSLATSALTLGAPELGQTLAGKLPASLDIGNPNSPSYATGATIAVARSLATPDGDEADAATVLTDILDHAAPKVGTTSIFRAVSGAEARDIAANGFRQAPNKLSYEGKLFATSAQDPARFGRINYSLDQTPFISWRPGFPHRSPTRSSAGRRIGCRSSLSTRNSCRNSICLGRSVSGTNCSWW